MSFNSLSKLVARDIMKTNVLKLDPQSSLEEAVRTLADLQISGAPVVDRTGRLVGVLSARDIVQPENVRDHQLATRRGGYELAESSSDDDGSYDGDVVLSMEDYSPEVLSTGSVADMMTTEVVTVAPDAGLRSICKLMASEGIHRVIVVERGRVVGIVTTLDVVRALAEAD